MKRILFPLTIILFFAGANQSTAQDVEAGLFLGTAQYQGDLSDPNISLTLSETQPGFGGIFRYYFNPRFNLKANVYYGWISGDDKNHDDDQWRKKRNLSFQSHVLEGSAQIEFNILPYVNNSELYGFAPYIFTGVSVFNFNPKAEYQGEMVELQPLGTEGQGRPGGEEKYSLTQIAIPYGIGLKYSVGDGWNIGLEIGQRKTFTDYLDDVSTDYPDPSVFGEDATARALSDRSTELDEYDSGFSGGSGRGDPENDDWYVFTGFTITKTFRENKCMGF